MTSNKDESCLSPVPEHASRQADVNQYCVIACCGQTPCEFHQWHGLRVLRLPPPTIACTSALERLHAERARLMVLLWLGPAVRKTPVAVVWRWRSSVAIVQLFSFGPMFPCLLCVCLVCAFCFAFCVRRVLPLFASACCVLRLSLSCAFPVLACFLLCVCVRSLSCNYRFAFVVSCVCLLFPIASPCIEMVLVCGCVVLLSLLASTYACGLCLFSG